MMSSRDQEDSQSRYAHLTAEECVMVTSLMHGRLSLTDVPKVEAKVIKMFISSTTDMVVERNALVEEVFPKLRKYCRDKYGIEFEAVDLRWGVAPDSLEDVCQTEFQIERLSRCQALSVSPNFAVLLGRNDEQNSLPSAIGRSTFEAICLHVVSSGNDVSLLNLCYLHDHNTVPSVYRLQEVNKITEVTGEPWEKTATRLHSLILHGARMAAVAQSITQWDLHCLVASATEQETHQGLISKECEAYRENNCLLFLCETEEQTLRQPPTSQVTDRLAHDVLAESHDQFLKCQDQHVKCVCGGLDETENISRLKTLKEASLRVLPSTNTFTVKVQRLNTREDEDVDKEYISRLCDYFYNTTRILIDRGTLQHDRGCADDLYDEVVRHWALAATRCLHFIGQKRLDEDDRRIPLPHSPSPSAKAGSAPYMTNQPQFAVLPQAPLEAIRRYIKEDSSQPLVLHGESGVGKTSLLARAAASVFSWTSDLKREAKLSVICRFIGSTPNSSSICQLLQSVSEQITFVTGKPAKEVPDNYKSLKKYFVDLLVRGDFPGTLVIILDSLDQLSQVNGAHTLDWLPVRIAPNIKMIVSTNWKHVTFDCLNNKVNDNFIHLPPLPTSDAEQILKMLLEVNGRQVTMLQHQLIQKALQVCTLPLFIVLTFQEACRWRSYDDISMEALQQTVDSSILKLFERLECQHGKVLVSRVIVYISVARRGLSECELQDLLSLDEEVLNSVFTAWLPPTRRFPPVLWARLHHDLAPFLVEKEVESVVTLSWCHQKFSDAAVARYTNAEAEVHRVIADYYLGTWSGTKQKPFAHAPQLVARLRLKRVQDKACRFVPEMPLVFRNSEVCKLFNLRKMSQLPYSLACSGQFDHLRTHCLCNYEWLYTKLRATSVDEVLADFALCPDRETKLVADALRMSGSALRCNPDQLGAEVTGRLLPHVARCPALRELVRQCDLHAQRRCPLVPLTQLYEAPGGPLEYEVELHSEVQSGSHVDMFDSPDRILMAIYHNSMLKIWDLSQGEPRQDLLIPVGALHPSSDGRFLSVLRENRQVSIYQADSGQVHGHVTYDYGEVGCVAVSKKYLAISVERGVGPVVIDVEEANLVHRFAFHSHAVAFSPDDSYIVFNSGSLLLLHSLPLMERKCVGHTGDVPRQLVLTGQQTKCFLLTQTKRLQSVLFDVIGRTHHTHDVFYDVNLEDFTLSRGEKQILCRSARCLYLLDARREKLQHRLQSSVAAHDVFSDPTTTFTGAGFSSDDTYVVASAFTCVLVWSAANGQSVRVLQPALSPVVKLFLSKVGNQAATLLDDRTVQIWNLDHLDTDVLHTNEIVRGAVKSLAISRSTGQVVCHGGNQGHVDVKLVDLASGRVAETLEQIADIEVSSISLSPNGRYVLLMCNIMPQDENDMEVNVDWPLLHNAVLWDINGQQKVFSQVNCRFSFFDQCAASLGMVQCLHYNPFDWTDNKHRFILIQPDSDAMCPQEKQFDLPADCEFVGCPVLYCSEMKGTVIFIAVLQLCSKIPLQYGSEIEHSYETAVYMKHTKAEAVDFEAVTSISDHVGEVDIKFNDSVKFIRIQDLVYHAKETDQIVNVAIIKSNLLLITYVKDVECLLFHSCRGLVSPPGFKKGAVVYDPLKAVVLKHIPEFLNANSDIHCTLISRESLICVNQQLQVFDAMNNQLLCKVKSAMAPGLMCLALDGHYLVGLTRDLSAIEVYRTSDGVLKGSLLVHGQATCLQVAEDGRTVAVGTADGRVLLLGLTLELSDPYYEFIQKIPSRNILHPMLAEMQADNNKDKIKSSRLLHKDQQAIRATTPELKRLSDKMKSDIKLTGRRPPSFQSITNAVLTVQQFQRTNSQACCIQ